MVDYKSGAAAIFDEVTGAQSYPWRTTGGPAPQRGVADLDNLMMNNLHRGETSYLLDPHPVPMALRSGAVRFPSLVPALHREPRQTERAALYTRHTPHEWLQSNLRHYHHADTTRNLAERLRNDAVRVMREAEELTTTAQRDSGRRLGERITDVTFWHHEVTSELERLLAESSLLQETRRALEKATQDCEGPLHVAQECLYFRENRQGIDLVHDQVEISLLKEVETLRSCQARLKDLHEKVVQQLRANRSAQHELERDLKHKEGALNIDSKCHQLSNASRDINYFSGVEKHDATVSVPETWAQFSSRNVQRSASERASSRQLRSDADTLIASCASEMWDAWNMSNNTLSRRSAEVMEARSKLQMHLHKVQQEIFDVEKKMEQLRKAIMDKSPPMRVAQTRLEARTHRPDVELCRDNAQHRLIREVQEIAASVELLQRKLQEAEAHHQQLLRTRSALEADLQVKSNSLFIDREKCLGMRRGYPITVSVKY